MGSLAVEDYDIIILGAGLAGICSLHHLQKQFPSWRIKVIDAAENAGGTWFWNRYPGARVDTESLSYCFSFDKDVLQEWDWKDTFSTQKDTLAYIHFVCEKLDLFKSMQFNTRIESASWRETERSWCLTDTNQRQYTSRFLISCIGFLSAPTLPAIQDIDSFKGQSCHTSRWPDDLDISRDFVNKRIGVIGTGATGIQTVTAVSKVPNIKSLHVFQRTANWSAPLRNEAISPEEMTKHKATYDRIFQLCSQTPGSFMHAADPRKSLDLSQEERVALWEKLYNAPGFSKWLGPFSDTYTNREANRLYSDFMAGKIRARVNNPEIAESLVPKDHGFGTRRVPLESGYFEAFNQPNVHLVDLKKTPIEKMTATGIQTADGKIHELDILIYATGFDAITGAFNAIDWQAKNCRPLIAASTTDKGRRAIWPDHRPTTLLGLAVPSMPNLLMISGPHAPFGNAPRSIEHATLFAANMLNYCEKNGLTRFEATEAAAEEWGRHVVDCSKGALVNDVDSWMTGINRNVPGKTVRTVARYSGSAVEYRRRCKECQDHGYTGFEFA